MIASQYSQIDVFTNNTNHIVKQTENLSYISLKGRVNGSFRKNYTNQSKHMQNKLENRDVHERSQNRNCMEAQNVRMTGPSMSILESEIDGGITRIQMKKRF